jgi:uncharacterized protein YraI
MRRVLWIIAVVFVMALGGMGMVAASQPFSPPEQIYPYATPDPANVIVIPPGGPQVIPPSDPIDAIIAEGLQAPIVPTADTRIPNAPENFLTDGRTAIVTAGPLNVRSAPSTGFDSIVLGQLQQGEDVTILGLNDNLEWAFIDTRGPLFTQGWVRTLYIEPLEEFQAFPPGLPDAAATGFTLRARNTVNIRLEPVLFSDRVGILPQGAQAEIIGRTSTYSWWKIKVDGTVGWVSGSFVYPEQPAAYNSVPILVNFGDD